MDTTPGDAIVAPTAPCVRPRRAVDTDVDELVRLRELMFEEMGLDTTDDAWKASAREIIRGEMAADRLVAVVVDDPCDPGRVAASGIVQFDVGLPFPGLESPGRAYVSSMSTDRDRRGRGYAGAVLGELLDVCASRGVEVIGLHATEQGRPIYERHGFRLRSGSPEMRLVRRLPSGEAPLPR